MPNKFLEKIFLPGGFPSIYFCCHSEWKPDFEISDVTEWNLDPLLTPVINCLCSDIRDPVLGLWHLCSQKWLLSTVRAQADGAKHFPRQLASKVNGGPAVCCWRQRCEQNWLNLASCFFFNVVLNLTQKGMIFQHRGYLHALVSLVMFNRRGALVTGSLSPAGLEGRPGVPTGLKWLPQPPFSLHGQRKHVQRPPIIFFVTVPPPFHFQAVQHRFVFTICLLQIFCMSWSPFLQIKSMRRSTAMWAEVSCPLDRKSVV